MNDTLSALLKHTNRVCRRLKGDGGGGEKESVSFAAPLYQSIIDPALVQRILQARNRNENRIIINFYIFFPLQFSEFHSIRFSTLFIVKLVYHFYSHTASDAMINSKFKIKYVNNIRYIGGRRGHKMIQCSLSIFFFLFYFKIENFSGFSDLKTYRASKVAIERKGNGSLAYTSEDNVCNVKAKIVCKRLVHVFGRWLTAERNRRTYDRAEPALTEIGRRMKNHHFVPTTSQRGLGLTAVHIDFIGIDYRVCIDVYSWMRLEF